MQIRIRFVMSNQQIESGSARPPCMSRPSAAVPEAAPPTPNQIDLVELEVTRISLRHPLRQGSFRRDNCIRAEITDIVIFLGECGNRFCREARSLRVLHC